MEGIAVEHFRNMIIPFRGLKTGIHEYAFEIDESFFEAFEYSEITRGLVKVDCKLDRQARMMVFDFSIRGTVRVQCDRCLEEYDQEVSGIQRLIVKVGEERVEEAEDVITIPEKDHEVDLRQVIFEYIQLLVPYRRVHGVDENGRSLCNEEMIRLLEKNRTEGITDPRWEQLRKLKKNDNNI